MRNLIDIHCFPVLFFCNIIIDKHYAMKGK